MQSTSNVNFNSVMKLNVSLYLAKLSRHAPSCCSPTPGDIPLSRASRVPPVFSIDVSTAPYRLDDTISRTGPVQGTGAQGRVCLHYPGTWRAMRLPWNAARLFVPAQQLGRIRPGERDAAAAQMVPQCTRTGLAQMTPQSSQARRDCSADGATGQMNRTRH